MASVAVTWVGSWDKGRLERSLPAREAWALACHLQRRMTREYKLARATVTIGSRIIVA